MAQRSAYLKSHDFGALRALLTLKLFTFYIPVLTGYRPLLMRVKFRTAITRPDVSAISDLNKILVKNRGSDIKTTAC